MAVRVSRLPGAAGESGQAALLLLGVMAALVVGALFLGAIGQALGAKSRHQRAADLAAVSAARSMSRLYPRLFEPPVLPNGAPNPRHLPLAVYLALARRAAIGGARRNGVAIGPGDVRFPLSFAPTRVTVITRGAGHVRIEPSGHRRARIPVRGRATAELAPGGFGPAAPSQAGGGGYTGPLAYRQGKPMRPDVAQAFDRMAVAARRDGVYLAITSGYRSDAEQARLFATHPDPKWVARPGTSLHRLGTELDLGPPSAYGWLATNAKRFGFVQRYAWEKWHFGFIRNAGSASVGYGRGSGEAGSALPSFVPAAFHEPIVRAAQRWNVGAALLAAQLYAESNFNPFAQSGAGAQGIAQFMPGTAHAYGLGNPYDAAAAIDAQAHLMHDLLRRFGAVPLALAAYNAGSAPVAGCGCVPPYPETTAYVTRILGLLGAVGDIAPPVFGVRLVE
jgi:transglycosylase-like protein with SLT domain/D-alanyl-D-alanine carboxypeptidase-like protein/putative Flp pilus-assembly TadE/G-like protein